MLNKKIRLTRKKLIHDLANVSTALTVYFSELENRLSNQERKTIRLLLSRQNKILATSTNIARK